MYSAIIRLRWAILGPRTKGQTLFRIVVPLRKSRPSDIVKHESYVSIRALLEIHD